MFLENSQLVIEVLLMIVLIAGIISSRLIVRRLGVIRESYTALNEMVSTLDSSTEQVTHMFERVRHEVNQGDKRLSILLERVRNAEEDLMDHHKMAQESTDSLTALLEKLESQETGLKEQIVAARDILEKLEKQQRLSEQVKTVSTPTDNEAIEGNAGKEDGVAPHFSDSLTVPAPGGLRGPRPYMRARESQPQTQLG